MITFSVYIVFLLLRFLICYVNQPAGEAAVFLERPRHTNNEVDPGEDETLGFHVGVNRRILFEKSRE